MRQTLVVLLLVAAGLIKAQLLPFDPFDLQTSRKFFLQHDFSQVSVLPDKNLVELLSFDRRLFGARLLDMQNLLHKEYLGPTGAWEQITRITLALDPHDLNAIIIAAYQYIGVSKESFFKVDALIKEHIALAKKDWHLMMLMGYWWQFHQKDLRKAAYYAKLLYNNPIAATVAKETYPIVMSRLGEQKKAIALYQAMLRHTKDRAERLWLKRQIEELRHAKDSYNR